MSKTKKKLFEIVSNPDFLREGEAIRDFIYPDRVVIGTESEKSEKIMRELYRPLMLNETPIVSTTIETSEVIKYASNSFLATKIGFINQVADLCEVVGANVQDVAKGMGIDKRIGSKFLHAGPGFGGSCFPKDVKAFLVTAKKFNIDFTQMSLKFCEIQPFMTSVIIGATTIEQLKTNIESVNVKLTKEILKEINDIHLIHSNPCP